MAKQHVQGVDVYKLVKVRRYTSLAEAAAVYNVSAHDILEWSSTGNEVVWGDTVFRQLNPVRRSTKNCEIRNHPDLPNVKVTSNGVIYYNGRARPKHYADDGRRFVVLRGETYYVDAMVACTFHRDKYIPYHRLAKVAHLNGDITDDRAANLTWTVDVERELEMMENLHSALGQSANEHLVVGGIKVDDFGDELDVVDHVGGRDEVGDCTLVRYENTFCVGSEFDFDGQLGGHEFGGDQLLLSEETQH